MVSDSSRYVFHRGYCVHAKKPQGSLWGNNEFAMVLPSTRCVAQPAMMPWFYAVAFCDGDANRIRLVPVGGEVWTDELQQAQVVARILVRRYGR